MRFTLKFLSMAVFTLSVPCALISSDIERFRQQESRTPAGKQQAPIAQEAEKSARYASVAKLRQRFGDPDQTWETDRVLMQYVLGNGEYLTFAVENDGRIKGTHAREQDREKQVGKEITLTGLFDPLGKIGSMIHTEFGTVYLTDLNRTPPKGKRNVVTVTGMLRHHVYRPSDRDNAPLAQELPDHYYLEKYTYHREKK